MSAARPSARLRANRENARRSTGPRTPEGKRKSSRNAVVHELRAKDALSFAQEVGVAAAFIAGEGALSTHLQAARSVAEADFLMRRSRRLVAVLQQQLLAGGAPNLGDGDAHSRASPGDEPQSPLEASSMMRSPMSGEELRRRLSLLTLYERRAGARRRRAVQELRKLAESGPNTGES